MRKYILVCMFFILSFISISASEAGLVGTWEYGPTEAVAVKDSTTYISSGSYLWVLNISDETAPALVEEIKLDNYIYALRTIGNYLYVCKNDSMLLIYDIHDERNITLSATTKGKSNDKVMDIGLYGDTLYICRDWDNGEQYFLNDTVNILYTRYVGYPNQFGRSGNIGIGIDDNAIRLYDLTRTGNLYTSNSGTSSGDKVRGLEIKYPYVYIGNGDKGILTVNMSNYASILKYTPYPTGGYTYDVELLDDTLVVTANGLSGVGIYKIVDDTTFSPVGTCGVRGYAYELEVVGDRVYVGSRSGGLSIVDISDRTSPLVVGEYDGYSEMRGFCIEGDRLYAAGGEGGLNIYDISNIQDVQFISKTYGRFISEDVKVEGNYAYIAEADSGLTIMDISDENNPYVVGSTVTSYYGRTVDVSGDVCACGGRIDDTSSGGLSLLDVSNKMTPVEETTLLSGHSEVDFSIEDTILYCKGNPFGDGHFDALNIKDASAPVMIDSIQMDPNCGPYAIMDTLLFLTMWADDTIYVYNKSDVSNMFMIYHGNYYSYTIDIYAMRHYLAVARLDSIIIADYIDPLSPIRVYQTGAERDTVTEIESDSNKYIYMNAGIEGAGYIDRGRYGLKIYAVDVSMPTSFTITEPQSGDTVSQDSMRVTWHKSTSEIGIENYEVYINGIKSAESPDTTVNIVSGLGGTMEIWVEALDKIGNRVRSDSVVVEDYTGIGRNERKETKGIRVISSIKGIVVRNEGTEVGEYRISDITGRVVKEGEIESGMSIRVDIKSGIYFVRGEGNKESEKVLIIR